VGSISVRNSNDPTRTRRRLSRTFSRSRFGDYRRLLRRALGEGYALVSLERFLEDGAVRDQPRTLILRHDVDQHPASTLALADIERELGARATWYLRWRTADPAVIAALRAHGAEIGLHYETLTRYALTHPLAPRASSDEVIAACRVALRAEVDAFRALFGPTNSICAHGDTRVPWLRNLALVEGTGPETFGVAHDANLSLRRYRLGSWLTDRSAAEGSWKDGQDPFSLLAAGVSPILCLTHPNNWVGGPALWRDRALAAALPSPVPGRPCRVPRTRSDAPPVAAAP